MQLNESQKRAVCHVTGPMLVLAGPGSGKTRVITERIRYLVSEKGIDPLSILVVTFTRAAAAEMRNRYQAGCGRAGVTFGTFHSVFFYILKNAYGYSASDIVGEDEVRAFIIKHLPEDIWNNNEKDAVSEVLGEIGRVKCERYDIDEYYPMSCPADIFRQIYKQYDKWLKKNRKIDFDDMMVYTYELFSARKDILALWQNKFKYILVDEFQDINRLQYDILKMLAMPENNLFVVGDDDQAIYGFRGSDPAFMLGFGRDYPGSEQVLLDVNYRCSGNIVKAALDVIANNKNRFDKKLRANAPAGEKVSIICFKKHDEQNEYVARRILEHKKQGGRYEDIAVLYRTNFQPQPLLYKFFEYNIPVKLKEGVPNIYEHWIAKDIFAYVMLAMGRREREIFMRIINKPKRYISKNALYDRYIDLSEVEKLYEEKPWMCERIVQLGNDIKTLAGMTPKRALTYIDKVIGYGDYLNSYAEEHNIEAGELRDIYEQIAGQAAAYQTYDEWFKSVEDFKQKMKENNDAPVSDAVSCMTLHGAKGLEYDVVFIVDVNEGVMPYRMAVKPADIEEERRMFYVGMTRAKQKLYLLYSKNRYNRECNPSVFIDEIRKNEDQLR